jgi:hypothetical protein
MKRPTSAARILSTHPITKGFAAVAACLWLCGNLAQAQPTFSQISLPNAPNGGANFYAVGKYQFQGSAPSANILQLLVSSSTGVTSLTAQVTSTTLPGVVNTTTLTTNSGLTLTGSSMSEGVQMTLANDTVYTVVISAADSGGKASTTLNFDTINPAYFTFEAEDFDYGGGLYFDSLPAGTFPSLNAYKGLVSMTNVDCFHPGNAGLSQYRTNPLETEIAGDLLRLQYDTAKVSDYDIGYNNRNDWGNYTRDYPAGLYNIYLRGAGPAPAQANACEIGVVTSGLTTTNQTVSQMGAFSMAGHGYQSYTWCPAIDTNGNLVAWGAGGDKETLRYTVVNGNCNENFYLLVPATPVISPNNTTVYQGSPVTLSIAPYALGAITAVQWQTDNGSGGASWANASGASTTTTYAVPTNLTVEPYQFQVLVTIASNAIPVTVTSAVVTLNIQPPTPPIVVRSPVSITETLNANTTINPAAATFSANFTGSPTITYQWLSNSVFGGPFFPVPGATNTSITVHPTYVVLTNQYELQAINGLGSSTSAPATLIVGPVGPIQLAGDLIAELRSTDLLTSGTETIWTNRSASGNSVGNFHTGTSSSLKVSNNTINASLPLWAGNPVNALYVGGSSANALFSTGLTPAELNGNGPVSMEAWIYPTSVGGQQNQVSYGLGGGSGSPAEEREFGYGPTGYEAFTADYGSSDTGWATSPTVGWHYVAVTYDGANHLTVYQDGVANGTAGGPMNTIQTRLEVGQGDNASDTGGASPFSGYIAGVRVMSGVLTAGQIANNFNSGLVAPVPITVNGPIATPASLTQGDPFTLTDTSTTNFAGLSFTYQWYTDNGSGGTSFTAIPGATNTSLAVDSTGLTPATYEYEIVYTSSTYGIVVASSPVSVLVGPNIPPTVVQDITPATNNTFVTVTNSFSALFDGRPPLTYMWQVSSNGSTWFNTGDTTTNITVESEVPETIYYRLSVSNSLGTTNSSVGTLIVAPALPLPPFLQLQTAGDIVMDLENADLNSSDSAWANKSIGPATVGNLRGVLTNSPPTLNVSKLAPYLYNRVNSLFVNDAISNALQSVLVAPAEILGNKPVSAEAWIYATGVNQQNSTAISYGDQGGSGSPQEDREFNYCTAGGGATSGDFGNYDMQYGAGSPPTVGAWHYLAWTYDGSTISVYVDGTFSNSKAPGTPNITPETVVSIGAGVGPAGDGNTNVAVDPFTGFIGAARVESGVLTASQISNNFNAGLVGIIPVSLGPPSLTPLFTASGVTNAIDLGQSATLGVVAEVTNALFPTTYQWYTDNGSAGATWTAISAATNKTYVYNTTALGAYQFEVLATNIANSVGSLSPPNVVNVVAATGPAIVQDTTPASNTVYVTQTASFTAAFSGGVPMYLQWQQSPNGVSSWISVTGQVTGATGTNLNITPTVAGTNYYRLYASNAVGTASSTAAQLIVLPAPALPPPGTVQVAGDLIANLEPSDLTPGVTSWRNETTNANSVGNFTALGGGALNLLTLAFNYTYVNVLNVAGAGNNAVASALLTPSEINGGQPVSMEVWVNATGFGNQDTPLSYGVGGGSGAPSEERSLGYGTAGYGGFTADYGSADLGWSTTSVGWHYLVATYDGNAVILYQDGAANGSSSSPGALLTVQSYINVGSANGGTAPVGGANPMIGSIAAARIMSGVLSAAQVQSNYVAGVFGTVPTSLLPAPNLGSSYSGGVLTLSWPRGTLVSATSLSGPWTPVVGATSPYQVTPTLGAHMVFYRVRVP